MASITKAAQVGGFLRAFLVAAILPAVGLDAAAAALTFSWTGAASDRWSDQNNWNPIGVPSAGDNLAFPSGTAHTLMLNDLPADTVFATMAFNTMGYRIGGNAIGLSGGIATNSASPGGSNTFDIAITLTADQTFNGGTFNGRIDVGGHVLTAGFNPLTFNGEIAGAGTILTSMSQVFFTGTHSFSGVLKGNLRLEGANFPNASVALISGGGPTGTAVMGAGTVGGSVTTSSVAPGGFSINGDQPGILNFGSLTFASQFFSTTSLDILINGSTPGTGYDQVNVAGPVTLANTNLNVTLGSSFAPGVGQVFRIIDAGANAISGTFNGLPQGAVLTIGANQFTISYLAGAVTLTCTVAPSVWTGAVSNLWSDPGNWLGGVPVAGSALTFPSGTAHTLMLNDLPANTVFSTMVFNTMGYRIGGNAIGLSGGIATNSASPGGSNTFDIAITLTADQTFNGGTFNGRIDVGGHVLTAGFNPLTFNGEIAGAGTILTSMSQVFFTGTHSFSGVLKGNLRLEGANFPNASVALISGGGPTGTAVMGAGTVGGSVTTSSVAPGGFSINGDQPGILNFGSLTFASQFFSTTSLDILINGSTPGTGYDQVNVAGPVTLANTNLNVTLGSSFAPGVGQVFRIIDAGANAISGTFNGLPQGAVLTIGANQFTISYLAGAVTLTCTVAPSVWTGAVSNLWSDPGNWLGGVPVAGSALTFPSGTAHTLMLNDLPANTVFSTMVFNTMGYRIGGNAIGLSGGIATNSASPGGSNTFDIAITLTADQTFNGGTFNGRIDVGGHVLTAGFNPLTFNGEIAGAGTILTSMSQVFFTGTHSFSGVLKGNLRLEGANFPNASVALISGGGPTGTAVMGAGTVGGSVTTSSVAPGGFSINGDQPGILNFGSLTFASQFFSTTSLDILINGSTPGTGYDQVNVAGPVTLANTNLNVTLSPSFVPTAGDTYTIVKTTTRGPIVMTFTSRPEGSVFTLNSVYLFSISYVGGTGADIVLVSLNGKDPTNTTIASSANPSTPGQSVTFTAHVLTGTGTPTGEVWFRDGTDMLAIANLSGGVATFTTSTLAVGTHAITAQYRGDPGHGGSTSPALTQSVTSQGVTPINQPGDPPVVVELTTNVNGSPTTIDLAFENVAAPGTTSVTVPPTAPAPAPSGFQFGNPPMYVDISTSAAISGTVTLCFEWTEGQFANEGSIRMWHFESGAWRDITTTLNTTTNLVCGRTTSLSPFALMEQSFAFSGFLSPVSNTALNAVKAGAAVPIKFSLGGDQGLGVIAAGYPVSSQIECGRGAATSVIDETTTAGGSGLSYAATTGQYTYAWKTDKSWNKTCRQFVIRFTDGKEGRAIFDFR